MELGRIFGLTIAGGMALAAVVVVALVCNETRKEKAQQRTQMGSAQEPTVEAKATAALPSEGAIQKLRSIIDHTDHLSLRQRHVLATLMLCGAGVIVEAQLGKIPLSLNVAARHTLFYGFKPMIEQAGFSTGTEITRSQTEALIRALAASEQFFWFCVKHTPLIQRLHELGFVLNTPSGEPIPEELLPTDQTINRLRALWERTEVPQNA